MSGAVRWVNRAWVALSLPAAHSWHRATGEPRAAQYRVLKSILSRNRSSEYGQRCDFAAILESPDPVRAFQHQVPSISFEDIETEISRVVASEPGVLFSEPVRLLEPTGGSTAAHKLIPYNRSLQQEFQRGIAPWVYFTYRSLPQAFDGPAYWSVTPVGTPSGEDLPVPVGFEGESDYLGGFAGRLIDRVMAVPAPVKAIDSMESFRYVTLLFLLARPDLSLISVWNPTFLTLLLDALAPHRKALLDDLKLGSLSPPRSLEPALQRSLQRRLAGQPKRAASLEQLFHEAGSGWDDDRVLARLYPAIWPRLALISCWADGDAAPYARRLASLFPGTHLQPKGLIATEAFVSLPWSGSDGSPLALTSHFFEFEPVSSSSTIRPTSSPSIRPLLAHQLERGQVYSLLLTTGGGLYRYRIGDQVEVVDFVRKCPALRFVGREGVSDFYGEKLNVTWVEERLERVLREWQVEARFRLLAIDDERKPPAYLLFIESSADDGSLLEVGYAIESALCASASYAYCRRLGQLGPVRTFRIDKDGAAAYIDRAVEDGQRAGDVKPIGLDHRRNWRRWFIGKEIDSFAL